ncbi:uncharacterized protein LOC112464326 [Temnothorax curvispinosus]|uniref:Uncharacterized protein LOC112464326 n=1 Tax=Temnothorax curvispinosus TaxID=300111 RepID=A0A6J1QYT7_9HYME|nr:uncharacterized protein LOC112464326 [Temnothorax curvispinosus]
MVIGRSWSAVETMLIIGDDRITMPRHHLHLPLWLSWLQSFRNSQKIPSAVDPSRLPVAHKHSPELDVLPPPKIDLTEIPRPPGGSRQRIRRRMASSTRNDLNASINLRSAT